MKQQALGMIETYGMVAAVEAADAALKTAAVELVNCEKVKGGLIMVAVVGEVAAVQAAVAAGCAAAAKIGRVISHHVIPRPLADLNLLITGKDDGPGAGPDGDKPGGPPCEDPGLGTRTESSIEPRTESSIEPSTEPEARQSPKEEKLWSMSVKDLRDLARKTDGLTIKGRQISKANKEQLIAELIKADRQNKK